MQRAPNSSYLTAIFLGSTSFIFLNFGLPVRADELGISAVGIGGMYAVFTGTMLLIRPLVGYCLDHWQAQVFHLRLRVLLPGHAGVCRQHQHY